MKRLGTAGPLKWFLTPVNEKAWNSRSIAMVLNTCYEKAGNSRSIPMVPKTC